ncbi:hypothetical protein [Niallia sp. RD1]|uniref:hypothetical protein n=1 Tax=Niallia sp. RD1 TaxID=2962858 RepID=UPI0020C19C57|nr:hypothetical protein [Niallia sp. RD1]UTI42128.1 hypothetical protein NKG37_25505 [Niallia sp. RD1]
MKQNNIESFKHLSQFKDIKDFNNNIEQWMIDIKSKFTKSELVGLKRLIRFCAKVTGVSNAKIATITKATHELDQYAISRSTFKRMTSKAQSLGLLVIHQTERKNGSKSSNVYVFNRFEPSNQQQLNHAKTINSQTTQIKDKEIRTEEPVRNDQPKVISNFVNKSFADYAAYFFQVEQIEELFRISYIHSKLFKLTSNELETASNEAIRVLVSKIRKRKVKNVNGYFNGIVRKVFKKYQIINLFNEVFEQ